MCGDLSALVKSNVLIMDIISRDYEIVFAVSDQLIKFFLIGEALEINCVQYPDMSRAII